MKSRINPPCGIVELKDEVDKLKEQQAKQERPRKRRRGPVNEWARRGTR